MVIFALCMCSSIPHCSSYISPWCISWESPLEAAPSWPRGWAASGEVQWPLHPCTTAALQWPISNIGNNTHSCILQQQTGPGINNKLRHSVAFEFNIFFKGNKNKLMKEITFSNNRCCINGMILSLLQNLRWQCLQINEGSFYVLCSLQTSANSCFDSKQTE